MPIERMTARKVRISEIMNGSWVKKGGMEPSYVVTPSGENVSRARVLGTVAARFLAEDGNFGSITLDDGTDTIRAKTFKTLKPLDTFNVGDIVDLIGKVREYNGEMYIIPEVIARAGPNMEVLRKVELARKARTSGPGHATGQESRPAPPAPVQGTQTPSQPPAESAQASPMTQSVGKPAGEKPDAGDGGKETADKKEKDDSVLRKEILAVMDSEPEGVEYKLILEKVRAPETRIESVLNEILAEGICYEPTPGKVKKI